MVLEHHVKYALSVLLCISDAAKQGVPMHKHATATRPAPPGKTRGRSAGREGSRATVGDEYQDRAGKHHKIAARRQKLVVMN